MYKDYFEDYNFTFLSYYVVEKININICNNIYYTF